MLRIEATDFEIKFSLTIILNGCTVYLKLVFKTKIYCKKGLVVYVV